MTDTRYGKSVEGRVEASVAELDRKVTEIAAEVRERLVVPLCRRRGFGFLAGNGDYFFHGTKRGESVRYGDSLDDDTPADVRRVLAVLDIEITHGQHLGFYVESVEAQSTAGAAPPRTSLPLTSGVSAASEPGDKNR